MKAKDIIEDTGYPETIKVSELVGKIFDIREYKIQTVESDYGTKTVAIATVKIDGDTDLKTAFFGQKVLLKKLRKCVDNGIDDIAGITIAKIDSPDSLIGYYYDFAFPQ